MLVKIINPHNTKAINDVTRQAKKLVKHFLNILSKVQNLG